MIQYVGAIIYSKNVLAPGKKRTGSSSSILAAEQKKRYIELIIIICWFSNAPLRVEEIIAMETLINFLDACAPQKKNVITSNIVIMTGNNLQFVDTQFNFEAIF